MHEVPIDNLGPYPLLQLAAAVLVLGLLAVAVYRGTRDRGSGAPQVPAEQRWFFDGPLATAINLLRDIKNHLSRIVEIATPLPEEMRKQTKLLEEIKEEIEQLPSARRRRGR
jgi:hypothetical protein